MRNSIIIILYFFISSIVVAASPSALTISDFQAKYDLYHNEMFVGESTRTLKTENKFLTYRSIAKTAGIAAWFLDVTITEISKLQLKEQQLNFFSYLYDEKSSKKNEKYQLSLDKLNTFYNSYTKEVYPVNKELHDTLGFTIAIMRDMKAGKREIQYSIAEKDSLKTYSLKLIGKENIPTNTGALNTLKMEHYDPQTKTRFTLWCAESMGFLPVRIQSINKKGDENLLNLTAFNQKKIYLDLFDEEID